MATVPERQESGTLSLAGLFRRHRGRILTTLFLVVLEAGALVLFPLVIGLAINDLLQDRLAGTFALAVLGAASLCVGAARRLVDTRTYAAVYQDTATEHAMVEFAHESDVSTIAARTSLLAEFVEFFENSVPMIVNSVIGIVGTLVVLAGIDGGVFVGALGLGVLVVATYGATGRLNLALTAEFNDELEQQVRSLQTGDVCEARGHFGRLMAWNRRLSDLETFNYSVVYLGVVALVLYSPVAIVDGAKTEYGFVFAAIMYVFQYVESVLATPLFIQQLIRLNEISTRLRGDP